MSIQSLNITVPIQQVLPPGHEKQVVYLDASAFAESLCMKRLEHIIVTGYRELSQSASLTYGTAFHKYVAALRTTTKHEQGILEASNYYMPISMQQDAKEWRTLVHLFKTCAGYHDEVYKYDRLDAIKLEGSDTFLIEQKFSIKVYEDDFFILMLSGTIDEIGLMDNNFCIVDRKTSSSYFNADAALEVYRSSTQLMFYKFIAQRILGVKDIPCFIDGIFISSGGKSKFIRSDLFTYDSAMMTRFEEMLNDCVKSIIISMRERKFRKEFRACNSSKYDTDKVGKCKFFDLCANDHDPELFDFFVRKKFKVVQYNPLKFDETN